jgi:TrmH family RNA methyltransferase
VTPTRPKPYKKNLEYAYSFGVFPTLELLDAQLDKVMYIIISSRIAPGVGEEKLYEKCAMGGIDIYINDQWIERLSPREGCHAIGVFRKYSKSVDHDANHIVLVNPSNMGNLGTILRTALGFGIIDVAIIRPAVDIFDPRVVRASMGAIFRMRCAYFDDIDTYLSEFGNRRIYAFMVNGRHSLSAIYNHHQHGPFSLIFGNEATGLSEEYHNLSESVYIPHDESIDSLNLAIAVGIACYTFST